MEALILAAMISTLQPDPEMSRTMEAAGGLTTLTALCPDIKLPQVEINRLLILEAALKMNPAYIGFFDRGVAMMTEEAMRNPNICKEQALNFETY